jgi:TolB-like protein
MTCIMTLATTALLLVAGPTKVAVFGFTADGVDETTARVSTSVFRTELASYKDFTVATADEVADALGSDRPVGRATEAREAAVSVGAAKAVTGSVNKLGSQTLVQVKLIDALSGDVDFEDQLATTSEAELDVVLKRLAKAVAMGKKSGGPAELGTILEKEGKEPVRREAWWGGGAAIGGFFPFGGLGTHNTLMAYSGCAIYETPDFFAELNATGFADFSSSGGAFWPITVNVFKVFGKTDFAPYAGGGLGIGFYASNYGSGGQGFVFAPGGGILLFRTYDFHVLADARYYVMFSSSGVQHGPALRIGLTYRRPKDARWCCFGGGCL